MQARKSIRHCNVPGHAHFLTFSCYQRRPFFNRARARQWFLESLEQAREKHGFAVWAYVLMPEHVHLVVFPRSEHSDIAAFLKGLKPSTARKAKHFLAKKDSTLLNSMTVRRGAKSVFHFWQPGPGYDRNIQNDRDLRDKIEYTHNNPVRRGLVPTPEDWEWSSAKWYAGRREPSFLLDEGPRLLEARTNKFVRGTGASRRERESGR